MPFTPAHPAIVLPLLNRKFLSATGLIAGSISPDFEYFFKARVSGVHGHTVLGIFYFDLPVVFFISLLFHLLIKESFISNLPPFLQRRLHHLSVFNFKEFLAKHYILFVVSALIGAGSHVLWDSFTHNGTYFVQNLSIYKGSYIPFQGAKYPLWYALQHISTFTGLSIIVLYIFFMPVNNSTVASAPKYMYWLSLLLLGGLFFAIRFTLFTVRFDLGNAVVTSISSLLLAICLVSPIPYFKTAQVHHG